MSKQPWWRLGAVCAVLLWAATAAAERVVELQLLDDELGVIVIYESAEGLFIAEEDVPAGVFDAEKLAQLPRYSLPGCQSCLRLSALGDYVEAGLDGRAVLTPHSEMMAVKQFWLYAPREASSRHLQQGFSLINNISLSLRDPEDGETASAAIVSSQLGLGPLGVIETGLRHIDGPLRETRRLPTLLRNHFVDAQISFELGEVRTDADPNDSGLGIMGLRLYRNFATRPDITSRPLYDFFALTERPSVVELYQNSQLQRREQVDRPGPVQLSDYRPSGSGKVLLVITDSLGAQRLVETDLFVDQRNLGRGVWDFGLSAGYLRGPDDEIDKESRAGSLRVAYGATNRLTLGAFADGVDYDLENSRYNGQDYRLRGGVNLLWSSPWGKFDLTAKGEEDDQRNRQESYLASWRASGLIGRAASYALGVSGLQGETVRNVDMAVQRIDGYRAFAGLGFRNFFVSGNVSEIGEVSGYGLGAGWRWRALSVDASAQAVDEQAPLYTLSVGYRFGGPVSTLRAGARRRAGEPQTESFVSASGRQSRANVHWRTTASHDDLSHDSRGELRVDWQPEAASAAYELRYVGEQYEQLADVAFGVGFVAAPAMYLGKYLSAEHGLAVIDAEVAGVRIAAEGASATTNSRGLAVLPVRGFGRRYATIDTSSLAANGIVEQTQVEVSLVPGHSSRAHFVLNAPSAFIKVEGASPGDAVEVNGRLYKLYEFGAFVENLSLGDNLVIYQGRRYRLNIVDFDDSLPTYTVGEELRQ